MPKKFLYLFRSSLSIFLNGVSSLWYALHKLLSYQLSQFSYPSWNQLKCRVFFGSLVSFLLPFFCPLLLPFFCPLLLPFFCPLLLPFFCPLLLPFFCPLLLFFQLFPFCRSCLDSES